MLINILLYSLYTILSAKVESIRIKKTFGKVTNIKHIISAGIAVFGFLLIILIMGVKSIITLIIFGLMCVLIRGVLYDPFLNKFRGLEEDYESPTTTSSTDKKESLFNWGFWKQRRIYLYSLIIITLIYYILKYVFCLNILKY